MKLIQTFMKVLGALALMSVGAGCATTPSQSQVQSKENLLTAAGFQVITPKTPDQTALLKTLPVGKVTPIVYGGKTYYVMPDAANNQAYVGGPKRYEAYQQLRLARQMSNDGLMAAQMNEAAAVQWGSFNGWGRWGGYYGWY